MGASVTIDSVAVVGKVSMAQKFLSLDEAADALGISKDRLNELREAGHVHAYRDGGSWKFKSEEVDRFKEELKSGVGGEDLDSFEELVEDDSILLSEIELGDSGLGPSSTIIGRTDSAPSGASDVRLADPQGGKADSDLQLVGDSGLSLTDDEPPRTTGSSDVLTAAGGKQPTPDSTKGSGLGKFEHLAEIDLDLESESSKILETEKTTKSDSNKGNKSDLSLASSGDSGVNLAADDDDNLVLGEGSGSDITLSSSDSGIGLAMPADSGLSLDEQPLELGGSAVESFELGEDEISLEESLDSEAATQLKADDDFLLTPLDDAGSEGEMEDSGSQVIALDSDSFDESADTLLGAGAGGAPLTAAMEGAGMAAMTGPAAAATLMMSPSAPEMPYSVWNIIGLLLCMSLLGLSGVMMFDLLRNMWSWNEAYSLNSSVIDGLMKMIPIGVDK